MSPFISPEWKKDEWDKANSLTQLPNGAQPVLQLDMSLEN